MCCALGVVSRGLTEFNCVCGRGALGHCVVGVMQPQSGGKAIFHSPSCFHEQEGDVPKLLSILPTGEVVQLPEWVSAQPVFVPSAYHLPLCFFYSQAVNT